MYKKTVIFILFCYSIFSQGRIIYPGFGIFSLEEGTFEAWVKLEFDTKQQIAQPYLSKGRLFEFEIPKDEKDLGATFSIVFLLKKEKDETTGCYCRIWFSIEEKVLPKPIQVNISDWEKDSWHHLAISWFEGKKVKVYIDGKERKLRHPMHGNVTVWLYSLPFMKETTSDATITLGNKKGETSLVNLVSIDEVRISSIARDKEELGYYKFPLIPDEYTLFLENFENIEGEFTKPFISNIKLQNRYKIEKGKLIEGKIGKGYSFSAE